MSLVETGISIAIISTAVVIAVPSLLQTRDDYVIKSTAKDVASRMHSARIRAISRNIKCRIRVTSDVTYAVECEDPGWTVSETVALPRGMTIVQNARPEFHRLGN